MERSIRVQSPEYGANRRWSAGRLHATRSFADETSVDIFRERNTRFSRRISRELWRTVQRKLKALDVAARLDDLLLPAGNRLERLKGNQLGRHSIRVNDQYRITFRWENGHAHEVCIEDYH